MTANGGEFFGHYFAGGDPNELPSPEPSAALSPPGPPRPPAPPSAAPAEQPGDISRRDFLVRAGGGLAAAVGLGAAGTTGGYFAYEAWKKNEGRHDAEQLFEDTLLRGRKLAFFDGLVQVDYSVPIADGIFDEPYLIEPFRAAGDNLLVAVRPVGVQDTLIRNLPDQDSGTQGRLKRALPDIPPGLIAFYWPNSQGGGLTFIDADAHPGRIVALTENVDNVEGSPDGHLPMYDIDVDGHEIYDGVAYPYTKDSEYEFTPQVRARLATLRAAAAKNPTEQNQRAYREATDAAWSNPGAERPVEVYRVIGHATTVNNAEYLDVMVSNFYAGGEPISLPYQPTPPVAAHVNLRSNPAQ